MMVLVLEQPSFLRDALLLVDGAITQKRLISIMSWCIAKVAAYYVAIV